MMKIKGIMSRIAMTFVMTGMIMQTVLPVAVGAQETGSEPGEELLINGGAEEHLDESPIYGWVEPYKELGGNPYYGMIHHDTYPHNWNTELRAHSGERFFCTNLNIGSIGLFRALGRTEEDANGPIFVYQDVDITDYTGAKLILSGYVGKHSYISINLLDEDGEVVARAGEKWREQSQVPEGEWAYREYYVRVPEDAVTARVFLTGSYEYTPVGIPNTEMFDRTEGYFDDISLVADTFVEELPDDELLYNRGAETGILDEWHFDEEKLITDYCDDMMDAEIERAEHYPYDDLWAVKTIADGWCDDEEPYEGDYLIAADHNRGPRGLEDFLEEPWTIALYQEVDVSVIPKGTVLNFSGYICERGWLSLEIYDKDNKLIASAGEEDETIKDSSFDTWTKQECQITLPEGAFTLRALLHTRYSTTPVMGGALERVNGCFDELSLKAKGWEKPEGYTGRPVPFETPEDKEDIKDKTGSEEEDPWGGSSSKEDEDIKEDEKTKDKTGTEEEDPWGGSSSKEDEDIKEDEKTKDKTGTEEEDPWGGSSSKDDENTQDKTGTEEEDPWGGSSSKEDEDIKENEQAGKYKEAILYHSAEWFLNNLIAEYFPEKVADELETVDLEENIEGDWFVHVQTDLGNKANEVWDPEKEESYYSFMVSHMKSAVSADGPGYSMDIEFCDTFYYDTGEILDEEGHELMEGEESEDGLLFTGEVEIEVVRIISLKDRLYAVGKVYYPSGETLELCMVRENTEKSGNTEGNDRKDSSSKKESDKEEATGSASGSSEEKSYTDEEILKLAQELSGAPQVELEGKDEKGILTIHCFETVEDEDGVHTATWTWYEVDPETMIATDFFGVERSLLGEG